MDSSIFIAKRLIDKSSAGFTTIITKIATATVALGLVVMICANSVISGFQQEISNKIFGFWGHIHVNDVKITRSFESIPIERNPAFKEKVLAVGPSEVINEDTQIVSTTKGGIQHIQSYSFCPGVLNRNKVFEGIILKGISNDIDTVRLNEFLVRGSLLSLNDTLETRELIISEQTALRMEVDTGSKMIINFAKDRNVLKKAFTVSGIYKTGLEEYDQKFAFCDQRVVQDVLGWTENEITGYEIFLDHIEDAPIMADLIYNDYLPLGQYAETIQEKRPNIFEWLSLININERIIILLMILVSIINMSTVILIFILDRSHMIGVLKSVGYMDWSIRKIFLLQAFWLLIRGMFWGNLIALTFLMLQRHFGFIKLDEASYYLSVAPVSLSIIHILIINLLTIIVTTLSMIIPTYIITRIKPVKVLDFV